MLLMHKVSIGFLITAMLLCSDQTVFAANADCNFPESAQQSRPGAGQGPTAISVAVYLLDIPQIDDADQSFVADIFLRFTWKDPRLVHTRQVPCVIGFDKLWHPRILLLNQRNVEQQLNDGVQVFADGNVVYRQRFYGTFSLPNDLRDFPFDEQNLPISIIARFSAEEVNLVQDSSIFGTAGKISVANWRIGTPVSVSGKFTVAPNNPELARFDIYFSAQRHSSYYVWKIIFPMSLVIFMSWAVFWVSPQHLIRLSISATSILTLIAFRLAVGGSLPPISYLTKLDLFTIGATAMVFTALIETVASTALWDQERQDLASQLNRWSRVIFPLSFVALLGFMIGY